MYGKNHIEEAAKMFYSKEWILCLLNWLQFGYMLIMSFHILNYSIIIGLMRRLIALTQSLQWSICMHHLESQVDHLKDRFRSILKPINVNACDSSNLYFSEKGNTTVYIKLQSLDSLVNEYRIIAKQHEIINHYYGLHMVFDVVVVVYSLIVVCYDSWYFSTKEAPYSAITGSFLVFKIFLDLFNIGLVALISESTTAKVRVT